MSNLHRESRVGQKEFQATIPPLLFEIESGKPHKKLFIGSKEIHSSSHNLSKTEMKEYLLFAKSIALKDGKNDNEGLLIGLPSVN